MQVDSLATQELAVTRVLVAHQATADSHRSPATRDLVLHLALAASLATVVLVASLVTQVYLVTAELAEHLATQASRRSAATAVSVAHLASQVSVVTRALAAHLATRVQVEYQVILVSRRSVDIRVLVLRLVSQVFLDIVV